MKSVAVIIMSQALCGPAPAQIDDSANITAVLRREAGVTLSALDLDAGTDEEGLLRAAERVERAQGAQKGEFETTAEFKERYRKEWTSATSTVPGYFVFLQVAKSSYDADNSTLAVNMPASLLTGKTSKGNVSVHGYGGEFPRAFLGADQPRDIVLSMPRDEARQIKPGLSWAIIARLPLNESAENDSRPVVSPSGGGVSVAMLPLKGILFSKVYGRVLSRIDFVVPADVRARSPDATLEDWLQASEATRRLVASRLFSGKQIEITALWMQVRKALELKQLSSRDPITALLRVPELPKPTGAIPVRQMRPKYPFEMRRAGISGEVVVGFKILESGKVSEVKAVRSSQREFEAAAIACVTEWTFKPATLGGKPIEIAMEVPIVFSLD